MTQKKTRSLNFPSLFFRPLDETVVPRQVDGAGSSVRRFSGAAVVRRALCQTVEVKADECGQAYSRATSSGLGVGSATEMSQHSIIHFPLLLLFFQDVAFKSSDEKSSLGPVQLIV